MMGRFALGVLLLVLLAASQMATAQPACPVQPLSPAIDSIQPPLAAAIVITFAATPREYQGHAWIVRLSRVGYAGPGTLEIVRLRRQRDCNRYDIEKSWRERISAEDYSAVAEAVAPLGTPREDTFSPVGLARESDELVLDGTAVELRLTSMEWETRRRVNHYGPSGRKISVTFYALVAKYVQASEMPADNWRTRGSE